MIPENLIPKISATPQRRPIDASKPITLRRGCGVDRSTAVCRVR
jgi:hypothetical protein